MLSPEVSCTKNLVYLLLGRKTKKGICLKKRSKDKISCMMRTISLKPVPHTKNIFCVTTKISALMKNVFETYKLIFKEKLI